MDPRMFAEMMSGGGPPSPSHHQHRRAKPQTVAGPVEVSIRDLYSAGAAEPRTLDMDELADDEMKEMLVCGKHAVHVEPGMRHGSRVLFEGKGVKVPGIEDRGDLAAVLQLPAATDADAFRVVQEDDLLATLTVTLQQALLGFAVEFTHVDGSLLLIRNEGVCKPGDLKVVRGKGLPLQRAPKKKKAKKAKKAKAEEGDDAAGTAAAAEGEGEEGAKGAGEGAAEDDADDDEEGGEEEEEEEPLKRGDLILGIEVTFPRVVEEQQVEAIRPLLPSRMMVPMYLEEEALEVCEVNDVTEEDWKAGVEAANDSDDDDDSPTGGGGVQCAHQ